MHYCVFRYISLTSIDSSKNTNSTFRNLEGDENDACVDGDKAELRQLVKTFAL